MARMFGVAHESFFVPSRSNLHDLNGRPLAESSWMAAPFVGNLLRRGADVLHIVRHPVAVVNSLEGIKFWDMKMRVHTAYRDFIAAHVTLVSQSSVAKGLEYWTKWNERIGEHPVPRIRIEDIAGAPRLNQRQRGSIGTWDDIPDSVYKRVAQGLATEYGYT